MRRASRLFEIIQVLRRARGPVSADVIARELEVSKRTIYRDIAVLIAQRVPITGEAGVGYVLERGFDMPPLMLTENEIDAFVLGTHWVASRGEAELAAAARSLLAKIEAVVPEELRAFVLTPTTSVAPVAADSDIVSANDLRAAIRSRRKLRIVYRGNDGQTTNRVVWPVLLGYRDVDRILAAWCELRQGFRYFRTDRLLVSEVMIETVPERASELRKQWKAAMDAERIRYLNEKS
ncbi:MAG: YafY family protein [Sphingorhabdus sp.]